jgi:hypothetical protein
MSTPVQKVEADLAAAKAWYKSKPLYAGMIIGAIVALVTRHFM